jgi:hypothetical protein
LKKPCSVQLQEPNRKIQPYSSPLFQGSNSSLTSMFVGSGPHRQDSRSIAPNAKRIKVFIREPRSVHSSVATWRPDDPDGSKTIINHHHFYRWYTPFPNGLFMALFYHVLLTLHQKPTRTIPKPVPVSSTKLSEFALRRGSVPVIACTWVLSMISFGGVQKDLDQ